MLSAKQLQKLGKRLRLGADPADIELLNEYRRWFDSTLLGSAFNINSALSTGGVPYLLSGRAKRTKSIIRKLLREPTMDLSRMTDIVGLRIVVAGSEEQQQTVASLPNCIEVERIADYSDAKHFYRAVHVHGRLDGRRFEVQVRTLAQQLWADESESFGEQAKEGQLTPDQKSYLKELRNVVWEIDCNQAPQALVHPLAIARRPIEASLKSLRDGFTAAANAPREDLDRTLLAVHDEALNALTRQTIYGVSDRAEALTEYERLMNTLEQTRFSVLLLNANNLSALKITHPRFFRGM